jgi:hypothetical protein
MSVFLARQKGGSPNPKRKQKNKETIAAAFLKVGLHGFWAQRTGDA